MTSTGSEHDSQIGADLETMDWGKFHSKPPVAVSSSSSLETTLELSSRFDVPIADPLQILKSTFAESLPSACAPETTSTTSTNATVVPVPVQSAETDTPCTSLPVTNPLAPLATSEGSNQILMQTPQVPIMPAVQNTKNTSSETTNSSANTNTVPEFLYQLTKMLTDNNKEVIEWANGKIEVHNPHKLASDVLHKYFRHSKFASFQRQLNYFGFRKLAGKGKMAPCSYVNDATTDELTSLLLIKRKTGPTPAKERGGKKRERSSDDERGTEDKSGVGTAAVNPVLAGILQRSASSTSVSKRPTVNPVTTAKIAVGKGVKHQLNGYLRNAGTTSSGIMDSKSNSHITLAQTAVGKGVRHGFSVQTSTSTAAAVDEKSISNRPTSSLPTSNSNVSFPDGNQFDLQNSLSELTNNYKNSLNSDTPESNPAQSISAEVNGVPVTLGMLSRESSLIDLAMLDPTPVSELSKSTMPFIDFPNGDLNQSTGSGDNNTLL